MRFVATFFNDHFATTKREQELSPDELAELIRITSATEKSRLPWIKLARFGDMRTEARCLRHDQNVLACTGVEADYDDERCDFEEAVEILRKARISAVVYTSPSYRADAPRWRVLCPFSRELAPEQRSKMLGRLNGLLGGIISVESWTLSQSYYAGSVGGNPAHRVEVIDGVPIDQCDELDKSWKGKPNGAAGGGNGHAHGNFGLDEEALLAEIRSGSAYHTAAIRLLGYWARQEISLIDAERRLRAVFDEVPQEDRDQRWRFRVAEIPRLLGYVWGKEAAGADNPRTRRTETAVVALTSGGAIRPERYQWVWPHWLPRGKLVMLGGPPGAAKTTIALNMAASVTIGGVWPDGSQSPKGDVVIWSGEDSVADTLLPRFLAAGGDKARVHFVSSVTVGNRKRAFDPSTDVPALLAAIKDLPDIALIIIDPVVLMVAGDSHKNAEVRRGLQPLVDLAEKCNAVALGITHLAKGTAGRDPVERLAGSLAFGAGPRLVMVAAKSQEIGQPRRLVRAKSNVGPDGDGFEYSLDQALLSDTDEVYGQRVVWGSPIFGPAWELLDGVEGLKPGRPPKERSAATSFLLNILTEKGPQPSQWLKAAAKEAGLAWRTIERAAEDLQIVVSRVGGIGRDGVWQWSLPTDLKPDDEEDL